MLILKVRVLNEIIRESGESTGCFVKDLSALDCRAGCLICCLEEKAEKLFDGFPSVLEGPGKNLDAKISDKIHLSESRDATLSLLADILNACESPSWFLANEKLVTIVEYMLWDATKLGLSQHLSGTAPCLLYDLERLLSLVRHALGT